MSDKPTEATPPPKDKSAEVQQAESAAPTSENPPKPHPIPRPGPRPTVAKPSTVPPKASSAQDTSSITAPTSSSDPSQWGRVDLDGTAWVITTEGERRIGSWQAGAPGEGLRHFSRRYDDLVTEVSLLERRLETHTADAADTRSHAEKLRESLSTAAVIGNLSALETRLNYIVELSFRRQAEMKERREAKQAEALEKKTKLAEEAEEIGSSATQWKDAGDRLREILDEWKTIHGVARATDDQLWKRFSRAREAFNRRRGSHFAELDRSRASVVRVKEEIIERAEALSSSTDWGTTAAAYRELMNEWKAAGRSQREVDDALWKRFRAAQDVFFDSRNAAFHQRDDELSKNGEQKAALLTQYRPLILDEEDPTKAAKAFHQLAEKWENIGKVPRQTMSELENGIKSLERHVAEAERTAWRRTDPEALARAQQFWDRVKQFEAQAERSEKDGKTAAATKARAQADQWREWAQAAENAVEHR